MMKHYQKKITNDESVNKTILNVGKDTLLYIPSRLFPVLFGFLGLTIYTRVFSPSVFGIYSLITAAMGIIGTFAYVWINQSNLRLFQPYRNENKLDLFFSTTFFLLLGTLIGSSVILLILSKLSLLPPDITKYLLLVIGVLFTTSLFETSMTILMSDRKPKMYSMFRSLSAMSYLAISLFLIFFLNYEISAIFLGYFLTNLIAVIILVFKLRLYNYISLNRFSFETLKEFADYGIPLLAALMLTWILMLSDRYIIEYFRGSYEVGLYSASYQLADYPISLISSTIITAAFPIIVDRWEEKGDQVTVDLISNIMKYYILFAIPTLAGVIILSKEFMLILGTSYLDGHIILPWICCSSLIQGLCVYINTGLELKKKTRILSIIVGIAAISNILLNLALVPNYGFYGAGVATGLAYLIYLIFSLAISRKYLKCNIPLKSVINSSLSSLIMGIALLFIKGNLNQSPFSLLLLTSVGAIIYIVFIFLSGELKNEIIFIRSRHKII